MTRHASHGAVAPNTRRHIALVGFMGSGKTTVGHLLAKHLGVGFIDLDEVITQESGKTVSELFRDQGEVAFRARERRTLREVLSGETGAILATGGGTFVDGAMRKLIKESARSVFLRTSPDALAARIATGTQRAQRPLLAGPDPLATIYRLLAERTPAYEEADYVVATDGRAIQDVVSEIIRVMRRDSQERDAGRESGRESPRLQVITSPAQAPSSRTHHAVAASKSERSGQNEPLLLVQSGAGPYPIELRESGGGWLADGIARICSGERIAVISDTHVAPMHAQPLVDDLRARGKLVTLHAVAPGEGSKSLETAGELYDQLPGLAAVKKVVAGRLLERHLRA